MCLEFIYVSSTKGLSGSGCGYTCALGYNLPAKNAKFFILLLAFMKYSEKENYVLYVNGSREPQSLVCPTEKQHGFPTFFTASENLLL